MFTGIVEEIGKVISAQPGKLTVGASRTLEGMKLGSSIAVNGVCLTMIALNPTSFSVEVMPETLRRTNIGLLRTGTKVNLERPLLVGGRLGGHFVQGHIDGTGKVTAITPEGEAKLVRFEAPVEVMRYVVEKGFIAIDGTSLTVANRDVYSFQVSIVGYTAENTLMGQRRVGDTVNLEVDIIAKYVEQLGKGQSGITLGFLAEHGFVVN